MFYREQFISLDGIRSYTLETPAENDFLLTIVDNEIFGVPSAGVFRLKSGFALSGETDDGVLVLESNAMTDWYWKRVCKGIIAEEKSDPILMGLDDTYVLTHRADPDRNRRAYVRFIDTNLVDKTFTPWEMDYYPDCIFNIGAGTKNVPIDLSEPTVGATLTKKYSIVQNYEIDLSGVEGSWAFRDEIPAMGCDGRVHALFDDSAMSFQEVLGVWELESVHGPVEKVAGQLSGVGTNKLVITTDTYEGPVPVRVYELNPDGSTTLQTIGSAEDEFLTSSLFELMPSDDKAVGVREWSSSWYRYQANVEDMMIYEIQQGEWNDGTEVAGEDSFGERVTSIRGGWRFADESSLVIRWDYPGPSIDTLTIVHSDGTFDRPLSSQSWDSTKVAPIGGVGTEGRVVVRYAAENGGHYVFAFSWSNGEAVYDGITATGDVAVALPPSDYRWGVDALFGDAYFADDGALYRINAANQVYPVADGSNMIFPADFATTPGGTRSQPLGGDDLLVINLATEKAFHCSLVVEDVYESGGLIIENFFEQFTSATSVTVSIVEPANTAVLFLFSSGGVTYKWDTSGLHWITHSDYLTGNTKTELEAADYSLFTSEVGADADLHVALMTYDGTSTPVFISANAQGDQGNDIMDLTTASVYPTVGHFEILAISDTQTSFKFRNSATPAYYQLCVQFVD